MCTLYIFCTNTIDVLTYILYTIYIFCTTTNDVLWHIFCTFRTYFVLVHYKMMPPFYVPYVLPCTLVQKRWQQYIKCTLFFLSEVRCPCGVVVMLLLIFLFGSCIPIARVEIDSSLCVTRVSLLEGALSLLTATS